MTLRQPEIWNRNRPKSLMNDDPLLNVDQVCERLNCSRSTVYRLINEGNLEAIRLGKRMGYRVRESVILNYVQKLEEAGSF